MWDQRGSFGEDYFSSQAVAEREAEERGRREQQAIEERAYERQARRDSSAADEGMAQEPLSGEGGKAPLSAQGWGGASQGGQAGKQAAVQSGNPYAIAAVAVKSWLEKGHRKEQEQRGFKRNMAAQRAGELGYPTYGVEYANMRAKQDEDPLGSIYYDPLG